MTNFERIKAMSVEEMVEFMIYPTDCPYCPKKDLCNNLPVFYRKNCLKKWLESEVDENG